MENAKVYFTKEITSESVVKLYQAYGISLNGKVAVKLHSGEEGNQNYIKPEFVQEIVRFVNGTVVECNTAYDGARDTTEKHEKLLESHGWTKYFAVDLLDCEGPDLELDIPDGKQIQKNYVGKRIQDYDSLLVLSHFKGHPMGGFGGALKQLSIGIASSYGKKYIHGAGNALGNMFETEQNLFLDSMADAAKSVHNMFKDKVVYINVMCNLSVDCDCCAKAEDPCMKDIGILISDDPIAIDQACVDFIYNSSDPGRDHFVERIERQNGLRILSSSLELGFGTREYELISID